jgi:signal transduction histidine kinase
MPNPKRVANDGTKIKCLSVLGVVLSQILNTGRSVREMIVVARSRAWAAAWLLAFVAVCVPLAVMATETKRVLLLHSYGREFAPYDLIVAAFRSELAQGSGEPVAIYDASLEAGQASGSDVQQPLMELLRHRFAASPPDVVVTIGPPAAAFYPQNRDQLFPGAPLVISGVDERFVLKSALRAGDAAVASRQSLPGVVDNILRLLPDTQKIVVVLGDSPLERFWRGEAGKQFARFANRVSFEWLNNLSLEQMRQRVAALPPHSAVLYTILLTDAAGVPHEGGSALASLVEASTAPIFSLYQSDLPHGVVGSSSGQSQREGALTAAAVLRALSGENPADPTIQMIYLDAWVYDWRELKRWRIDPARLPAGSEIRFQPPSVWGGHRDLIIAALSIFVLQAALLIGLVSQGIRRRRAEAEALTLSGRLITAHEDERRWLARELHDDITQRLAGLAIAAAKLTGNDSTDIEARCSIRAGLIGLSEDVHNLSYRLHPSVIEDLGLAEALKAECERIARTESIRVDVRADGLPRRLPNDVALGIYRVAQEALRNVGRHAKASIVELSLALNDGGLRLAVSDNGSGFELGVQPHRPSLGHASMRERIRLLGGALDIQSTPGGGTTIIAWVPITKVAS